MNDELEPADGTDETPFSRAEQRRQKKKLVFVAASTTPSVRPTKESRTTRT
jgi:hypothetical protein